MSILDRFQSSLSHDDLKNYVVKQCDFMFPDGHIFPSALMDEVVSTAIYRYIQCCSEIKMKYFFENEKTQFNHLMSDQYAIFLYFLSNELYKKSATIEATKIYYLNKSLHGLDVFYAIELPDIFRFCHPLGTVLGRANYDNYFAVFQNCTVGNNKNTYPVIGKNVAMFKGALLVGKCTVADNVLISAHSFIKDQDVPADTVAFGTSPDLHFKETRINIKNMLFGHA